MGSKFSERGNTLDLGIVGRGPRQGVHVACLCDCCLVGEAESFVRLALSYILVDLLVPAVSQIRQRASKHGPLPRNTMEGAQAQQLNVRVVPPLGNLSLKANNTAPDRGRRKHAHGMSPDCGTCKSVACTLNTEHLKLLLLTHSL